MRKASVFVGYALAIVFVLIAAVFLYGAFRNLTTGNVVDFLADLMRVCMALIVSGFGLAWSAYSWEE